METTEPPQNRDSLQTLKLPRSVAFFDPCNFTGAVREAEARSIGGDI
jgi:hypothetical protein